MGLLEKAKKILLEMYREIEFKKHFKWRSILTQFQAERLLQAEHSNGYPCFEQKNNIDAKYDVMVIIPVYNTVNYIDECLQSVLKQETTYTVAVTVIDDGSIDGSRDVLKKYCGHDNIRVIYQENGGAAVARNAALRSINASYVMFLDADDVLPDNAVQSLMSVAKEYNAQIVQGAYVRFDENGQKQEYDLRDNISQISRESLTGYPCMKLYKAEVLQNFCFPEHFSYEDTVLATLLYPQCDTVYAIPDVVYWYRTNEGSVTYAKQTSKDIDTLWVTMYCLEERKKRGYPLDETEYIRFLRQCYTNWSRTNQLSNEIQESIFILTSWLLERHYPDYSSPHRRFAWLDLALRKHSFKGYEYVMKNWDNL